jgi:hypothetical protein
MRERCSVGVVCALLVLVAALLTGCQVLSPASGKGDGRSAAPGATSTRPADGAGFLSVGECSSFGTTSFTEVPCTSERAAARVIARHDGAPAGGTLCPATTDFVLHIRARNSVRGYACMRDLEPPHPGDPGGGGGPRTIVGDCVYGSGGGQVRETACDGSGGKKPQYKVAEAVAERAECPADTALYVRLEGGGDKVGCARPV